MLNYEPGSLARSLAGRDKGRLYCILKEEEEYVFLADGDHRRADCPKRKKKKHVQLQYPQDEVIKQKLRGGERVTDREIRDLLEREASAGQGGKKNVESRCN